MYDTAAADLTRQQRLEMINLVNAVMPTDAGRDILVMRVDAKHAQARLLHRAKVNADPYDAAWAQSRADALLADCVSILLH